MEGRATNGCQWVATVVVVRGSVAPNEGLVGFGVCVLPTMLPIAPKCSPVEETVAGRGQPPKEPLCIAHPHCAVCTHIVLCAPTFYFLVSLLCGGPISYFVRVHKTNIFKLNNIDMHLCAMGFGTFGCCSLKALCIVHISQRPITI